MFTLSSEFPAVSLLPTSGSVVFGLPEDTCFGTRALSPEAALPLAGPFWGSGPAHHLLGGAPRWLLAVLASSPARNATSVTPGSVSAHLCRDHTHSQRSLRNFQSERRTLPWHLCVGRPDPGGPP